MIQYLRHMVVFFHVVNTGSISNAAQALNVSKSVVSQQLKDLETALGTSLLNRTTRQQSLTQAGQSFYEECAKINSVASHAWSSMYEARGLASGEVRISAPNAFVDFLVAPAITQLLPEHAGLVPVLLGQDQRVDLINDQIDLAIRVGKMPSSDYKQQRIGCFHDVLCASKALIEKEDLQNQFRNASTTGSTTYPINYIANTWQGRKIHHAMEHEQTGQRIQLSFYSSRVSNNLPTILAMLKAHCGIAYIPHFIFDQHRYELDTVLPGYRSEEVPIYAVYPNNRQLPLSVRLCIEAIRDQANQLLGDEKGKKALQKKRAKDREEA